ncbi:hypothetical protein AXE80_07180 [Wenyingzhuangia fucanilytica]|uniref:GIY-YIG domain-containing protein n=1 Tax=Wenyingzhuangia fucanilytica TaxID=1790137 RepID=A0A1B1Y5L4_9FLAO|nr:GIY-YIG nuclease family protein [Wenyingzhuangia fucanilytica]ANW96072.1 hypothetical protein AXE80_07180 [Wenyingzhuangia fucanilytica]
MPGYLYILKCSDDTFYTGSTIDLEKRIAQHNSGLGANYTKKRLPVVLVYQQYFLNIADAFYYEKKIQKWSKAKKLAIINDQWELLPKLSECKNKTHFSNYEDEN